MVHLSTVRKGKRMIIKSERVWLEDGFQPASLQMENGVITHVTNNSVQSDIDFGNLRIVPGFIDVHCHGAYGFDTDYGEPEGLRNWAKGIVHEGVTGFLATTVTEKKQVLLKAVRNVADVVKEGYEGAEILGIHFEGPYLDMDHKGAQPPEAIVKPSIEEFKEYQQAADGLIKIITIAPEHDENHALIKYCAAHGVAASLGHSSATYEEALRAFADGARSFTHTFNAMTPLHHRNPGLAGAALRLRNQYSEIICDCHHVSPAVLNIFFHAKNPDKAVMISDSLMCKGLPVGTKFLFGSHECEVMKDHTAHLAGTDTIAGSTMHTNEGLRNLVEKAGVPFERALASCTSNPAGLLGMSDRLGRIQTGYDANLAVLKDDYKVASTFVKGVRQF